MANSEFNTILHAIPDSMALVDQRGDIVSVNHAWANFGVSNQANAATVRGLGLNYFDVCKTATASGSPEAPIVMAGLKEVLTGARDLVEFEYPCNSPSENRWFIARVALVPGTDAPLALVSHVNITQRKEAELKVERESAVNLAASLTDPLTGLRNRRGFDLAARDLWHSARRRGGAMAAAFIDIDDFKPINDAWGHDEGDRVLKAVGAMLTQTFRVSDIVARVGGDEFLVLAWMTDMAHLKQLTSRLKHEVVLTGPDGKDYTVGLSSGVVAMEPVKGDLHTLVDLADKRMYEKKNGRKKTSRLPAERPAALRQPAP